MAQNAVAKTIAAIAFVIVVLGLTAVGLYYGYTRTFASANDFYIPWRATRALAFEGRDPYSESVTRDIQIALFGAPRAATEHQFAFAYPLYVSLILAPLTWLPYDAAQAFWQATLLLIVLGVIPIIAGELTSRRLFAIMLFALAFYATARGLILGQIAIVVFAAIALAVWGAVHGHERIAGVALAIATFKPQISFLVIPLLLLWAIARGRKPLLVAFALTMSFLLAASLLWMPSWPLAFIASVNAYAGYVGVGSPVQIASTFFGPFAVPVAWLAAAGLLGWLAIATWREARHGWPQIERLVMITLIVSQLIAVGTATTNQVVLLLPLWWCARRIPSSTLLIAIFAAFVIVPWWVFFATLKGNEEQAVTFLPMTFGVFGLWLSQPLWARWRPARLVALAAERPS